MLYIHVVVIVGVDVDVGSVFVDVGVGVCVLVDFDVCCNAAFDIHDHVIGDCVGGGVAFDTVVSVGIDVGFNVVGGAHVDV